MGRSSPILSRVPRPLSIDQTTRLKTSHEGDKWKSRKEPLKTKEGLTEKRKWSYALEPVITIYSPETAHVSVSLNQQNDVCCV